MLMFCLNLGGKAKKALANRIDTLFEAQLSIIFMALLRAPWKRAWIASIGSQDSFNPRGITFLKSSGQACCNWTSLDAVPTVIKKSRFIYSIQYVCRNPT